MELVAWTLIFQEENDDFGNFSQKVLKAGIIEIQGIFFFFLRVVDFDKEQKGFDSCTLGNCFGTCETN